MSASAIGASGAISGTSSPLCIRSPTVASRAPSRPPGCRPLKSSGVNARCSINATASASPSAIVIVVEVVGARPTEQASGAGGSTMPMSDCRISVESPLPATPISGIAEPPGIGDQIRELRRLSRVRKQDHHVLGRDHPEVAVARLGRMHEERRRARSRPASTRSCARRAPTCPCPRRSPARVPEASASTASAKLGPSVAPRSASAAASMPITRRPVAITCSGSSRRRRAHPSSFSYARRCRPRPIRRGPAAARCRQKVEAGRSELGPPLARQPRVQRRAEPVQVENVRGGILDLRLAQLGRAPVARLLLLGDVDLEKLARQILQPMSVGIGPDQPRGDLGAIDRSRQHAEAVEQHRDVEPPEMEELQHRRIGEHPASGSVPPAGPPRSAPGARRRRRPRAAPGRAGHVPAAVPSSRCRSPPPGRARVPPAGRADRGNSPSLSPNASPAPPDQRRAEPSGEFGARAATRTGTTSPVKASPLRRTIAGAPAGRLDCCAAAWTSQAADRQAGMVPPAA